MPVYSCFVNAESLMPGSRDNTCNPSAPFNSRVISVPGSRRAVPHYLLLRFHYKKRAAQFTDEPREHP